MAKPCLQGTNADPIFKAHRGKGVPELVKKPLAAIGTFRAFVVVFGDTTAAIQTRASRDAFQLVLEFLVWPSLSCGQYKIIAVWTGLPRFVLFERIDQSFGNRNLTFLFVLWLKPELFLSGNANAFAVEVDVGPCRVPDLFVSLTRQ